MNNEKFIPKLMFFYSKSKRHSKFTPSEPKRGLVGNIETKYRMVRLPSFLSHFCVVITIKECDLMDSNL